MNTTETAAKAAAAYAAGKAEARRVFNTECTPNWDMLGRFAQPAFEQGVRYEWDYLTAYGTIAPGRDVYGNRHTVEV